MQLIRIPIGEFWMGSPAAESGRWEGEHRHRVAITKSISMGIHEVTIDQFQQFVNATAYRTAAESDKTGGFGFDMAKVRSGAVMTESSTGTRRDMHRLGSTLWQI
jgi:formylglycine-generating enzyme required for sulfatase activity